MCFISAFESDGINHCPITFLASYQSEIAAGKRSSCILRPSYAIIPACAHSIGCRVGPCLWTGLRCPVFAPYDGRGQLLHLFWIGCDGLNLLVKHSIFLVSKEKYATYSDWVIISRERCIILPFVLKQLLNVSKLRVSDERQGLVLCLQFGYY